MILDKWQHEDYKVIKHITDGGSSKIFLIEQKNGTRAILKIAIEPKYINNLQIENEGHILSKLSHPAIPELIDMVEIDGFKAIIMSLKRGRNLKHVIETKSKLFSWKETLTIAKQLASIVDYFHNQNPYIVIRDIKPSNIVIDKYLRVQLVDFGTSSDHTNIIHNKAFGTVGYAAPEQFKNGSVHKESDIYSLGATLFYILFDGADLKSNNEFKSRKKIPKSMTEFIRKATQHDMRHRYRNTSEVLRELNKINYSLLEKIKYFF